MVDPGVDGPLWAAAYYGWADVVDRLAGRWVGGTWWLEGRAPRRSWTSCNC